MYFSLILIPLLLLLGIWGWKRFSWKIYIGYVEPGDVTLSSYRDGELTNKKRYFYHPGGMLDLKKHPELLRLHIIGGKDILIEPWSRKENIYLEEGESKIVIYETVSDKNGVLIIIPCLRKLETIITSEIDNPLEGYQETLLGVSWNDGHNHKVISGDNLIGVVRYESV